MEKMPLLFDSRIVRVQALFEELYSSVLEFRSVNRLKVDESLDLLISSWAKFDEFKYELVSTRLDYGKQND